MKPVITLFKIVLLKTLFFAVVLASGVWAAGLCEPCPGGQGDCDTGLDCVHGVCNDLNQVTICPPIKAIGIEGIISIVINIIFYAALISAFPVLTIGAVLYITSAGNSEQLQKAKRTITYGVIGFAIALFSYAIGGFIRYLFKG